jgi:hypothetical protein
MSNPSSPTSDMKLVGLRQFREGIDTFDDPIQVVKTRGVITTLGAWFPRAGGWDITRKDENTYVLHRARREVSSKA